jgi:hypothetical protein
MCIFLPYPAPEVICRMNHGFVSDFFAVGVIAYELMTGKVAVLTCRGLTTVAPEIRFEI